MREADTLARADPATPEGSDQADNPAASVTSYPRLGAAGRQVAHSGITFRMLASGGESR